MENTVSQKIAEGLLLPTRTVENLVADQSLAGETAWVAQGLVPRGALTIVYGAPKVGKGTLVTNLAKCVIAAEFFAGRATTAGEVLWVDLEQHLQLTRRKFEDEGAVNWPHQIHVYNGVPPSLAAIEETIYAKAPVLVVIDSLSRLLLLEDENSAAEVTAALAPLVELAHRTNVALIVIHHARKSEGPHGSGMRGSSAFLAVSDVALEVKRCSEDTSDERRKLVGVGRYDEVNETLILRRVEGAYLVEDSPTDIRRKRILAAITENPLDVAAIHKHTKLRRHSIQSDLAALIAAGAVLRLGTGTRGDPFLFRALR